MEDGWKLAISRGSKPRSQGRPRLLRSDLRRYAAYGTVQYKTSVEDAVMKLYDSAFSPFARKVRMVLEHKRLPFEAVE